MNQEGCPPFARRQLGRRLRELREHARISFEHAYRELEFSSAKLSRIETGENAPDIHAVKSMLDLYLIPASDWEPILELTREARRKGWWQAYGLDNRGFVPVEAAASRVRTFQLAYVPGLLQTESYARALFAAQAPRRGPDWIHNQIKVRALRQRRLTDDRDPLELDAIVDEGALRRVVGDMPAQLARLIECARLPRVSVQVVPCDAGPHIGMDGSFTLLSFTAYEEPEMAYIEHVGGGLRVEKEEQVRPCRLAFERLRNLALGPDESVRLIERLAGGG